MTKLTDDVPLRLTPAMRAWLERLEREGPCHRAYGPVARRAYLAGWTSWADDGSKREAITTEGRAALARSQTGEA